MSAHSLERSPRFCQSLHGGRRTSCAGRVYVCVRVYVRAPAGRPANNLTSHESCFFLNFNEKSTGNIFLRFSGSPSQKLHLIKLRVQATADCCS